MNIEIVIMHSTETPLCSIFIIVNATITNIYLSTWQFLSNISEDFPLKSQSNEIWVANPILYLIYLLTTILLISRCLAGYLKPREQIDTVLWISAYHSRMTEREEELLDFYFPLCLRLVSKMNIENASQVFCLFSLNSRRKNFEVVNTMATRRNGSHMWQHWAFNTR